MTDYLRKLREEIIRDPEVGSDPSQSNKLQQINQLELILATLNPHGATHFTPLYTQSTNNKYKTMDKTVITKNTRPRSVTSNENNGQKLGKSSLLSLSSITKGTKETTFTTTSTKPSSSFSSSSSTTTTVVRSASPIQRRISPSVNRIKPINSSTLSIANSRATESVMGENKYTSSTHNSLEHYPFMDHQKNVIPEILYGKKSSPPNSTASTTVVYPVYSASAVDAYISSTVSPPSVIGRSSISIKNDDNTIGRSISRFRGPRRGRSKEEIRHEELLYQITAMNAMERQRSLSQSRSLLQERNSRTDNNTENINMVNNNTVSSFEIKLDYPPTMKNNRPVIPPHQDKVLPPFFQPMKSRSISRERKVVIKEPTVVTNLSESTQTDDVTTIPILTMKKEPVNNGTEETIMPSVSSTALDNSSFEAAEEYDRSLNNDSAFSAADELDKSETNLSNLPLDTVNSVVDIDQPLFGGIEYQHLGDTDDEDEEVVTNIPKPMNATEQNVRTEETIGTLPVPGNIPTSPPKVTTQIEKQTSSPLSPTLDVDNSVISVAEAMTIPNLPSMMQERPPSRQSRRPRKQDTEPGHSTTTSLSSSLKRPVPKTKTSPTIVASTSVLASSQADYKPRYPSWWKESHRFTGSHTHSAGSLKMNPDVGQEIVSVTSTDTKPKKKTSSGYGSLSPFAFHRARSDESMKSTAIDTLNISAPEGYVHPNLWPHMLRTVDPKADISYHHPTHIVVQDTAQMPPPVPVLVPNATKINKSVTHTLKTDEPTAPNPKHIDHSSFVSEIPLKDTLVPKGGKPVYVQNIPSRIGDQVRLHRQKYKQTSTETTTETEKSSSSIYFPNWLILANESSNTSSTGTVVLPTHAPSVPEISSSLSSVSSSTVASSTSRSLNSSQVSLVPPPRLPTTKKAIAWTVGSDPNMETRIATQLAEHTIGANKINADLPMMNVKVKIGDFTAKLDRADPVDQTMKRNDSRNEKAAEQTFREVTQRAKAEGETLHLSVEETARRVIDMVMSGEVPVTNDIVTSSVNDVSENVATMNETVDDEPVELINGNINDGTNNDNATEMNTSGTVKKDENNITVSVPEKSNNVPISSSVPKDNETYQETVLITEDVMKQVDKAVALARAQADAAAAFSISSRGSRSDASINGSASPLASPLSSPVVVKMNDTNSTKDTTNNHVEVIITSDTKDDEVEDDINSVQNSLMNDNTVTDTTETVTKIDNSETATETEQGTPVASADTIITVTASAASSSSSSVVVDHQTASTTFLQKEETSVTVPVATATEIPVMEEAKEEGLTVTEPTIPPITNTAVVGDNNEVRDSELTSPSSLSVQPPSTETTINNTNDEDNVNEEDKDEETNTGAVTTGPTNTGKKASRNQRKKNKKANGK